MSNATALLVCALLLAGCAAKTQAPAATGGEDSWKEADTPTPPAYSVTRLLPIDGIRGSSLTFGVDPTTLSIGQDGVVRYVMIARSTTGAHNVSFEGIRCSTAEIKIYARVNAAGNWERVKSADWSSMWDAREPRYALQLARQGVCNGKATPTSVRMLLDELRKNPVDRLR